VANTPPAGESPVRVQERLEEFWQDLQHSPAMHGVTKIVVVTHNAVSRILLSDLTQTPLRLYRERRIDNASISKIVLSDSGKVTVVCENRTEHLQQ
jgi:broad specificity phosphatase PhoE